MLKNLAFLNKNKGKFFKTLMETALLGCLMLIILSIINNGFFSAIAGYLPGSEKINDELSKLPVSTSGNTLNSLTLGILGYVKIIVGAVGVFMITVYGGKMVMAREDSYYFVKAKTGIQYVIISFVIVSMTEEIAKILDLSDGTLIQDPTNILKRVRLFDNQVEIIITFIKYFIGAIATFMIAVSGMKLVAGGDNDDEISGAKRKIFFSAIGLLMITLSDTMINNVFYKVDKQMYSGIDGVNPYVDVKQGVEEIVGLTNLLIGIVGPAMLLIITVASIYYLTAGGDEERMKKAKRMVIAAVIGVIVIYGAFALVSTVLSSKLMKVGALTS